MQDRSHLLTEQRNPRSMEIDRAGLPEAFDIIQAEDEGIAACVAAAKADICRAVERVAESFRRGGRLIYFGAGTSGRLGVMDASECPPTFLTDPNMVVGIIAGGESALRRSVEGAEDSAESGAKAVDDLAIGSSDVAFGITSGGTTPYVHSALRHAKKRGASTIFLACVEADHVPDIADINIRLLVGPEVITGSTRLKAGTATKMVLNRITTLSMVAIGKVYENLMVDVNTRANSKLWDRGLRMIRTVTDLGPQQAAQLLNDAGGHVKTAIVMHRLGISRTQAEQKLAAEQGRIRGVLER